MDAAKNPTIPSATVSPPVLPPILIREVVGDTRERVLLLSVSMGSIPGHPTLYLQSKLPTWLLEQIHAGRGSEDYAETFYTDLPDCNTTGVSSDIYEGRDDLLDAAAVEGDISDGIPDHYKVVFCHGYQYC
jgi:hypothetical protein